MAPLNPAGAVCVNRRSEKGGSSPGWTRTNNPPVNSRMLCQLSYRGLAAAIVAGLREGPDLVAELRELLLELDETLAVGVRKLPLQPTLAQAQQQLTGRLERELLLVAERVQLGEQRGQLGVGGALLLEQVRPRAPVQFVVEVLRPHQLEVRQKRLVRRNARQGAPLEPLAGVEQARRDDARRTRSRARRERRLGLRREVEEVGCEAPRIEMLRRVRLRTQERLDRRERGVAVRSLCVQQAHAVYRITDWARELALECRRIVGRVRARLERDDLHVETLGDG